ncbi:class I SAM-dependent methyltransferase [Micromonospora sp. NPDC049559]|uniref:class I SAM-dependent methyltransferase n=1 Tax=Micromonospora sp. NPDC049559 TaxID=3155923 RepID=UPI0034386148
MTDHETGSRTDQALSFGAAAARYDRFRPPYPRTAASWIAAAPPPARVVDLGAGTGILTRTLIGLGYDVVPVEPDEAMRARLAAATLGATPLAGSAESIPLRDGEADAVVAGTAYHWFDRDRAHAEAARVLRPGGAFAAIWNIRDNTVDWVAELTRIADRWRRDDRGRDAVIETFDSFGPDFVDFERAEFRHEVLHTPESLVTMMTTRSYYLTASPQEQATIERELRALTSEHPQLAGRESFELPYRALAYRARRR